MQSAELKFAFGIFQFSICIYGDPSKEIRGKSEQYGVPTLSGFGTPTGLFAPQKNFSIGASVASAKSKEPKKKITK